MDNVKVTIHTGVVASFLFMTFCACAMAQCPVVEEEALIVKNKTLCARVYEHSHQNQGKSCRGHEEKVFAGVKSTHLRKMNDMISAVVVESGCRLTVWEHSSYRGYSRHFWTGVHTHLSDYKRGFWSWNHWNDVISSYTFCVHNFRVTMAMNYVGSISILDRGDAPAQAVIDRNARSFAQRAASRGFLPV